MKEKMGVECEGRVSAGLGEVELGWEQKDVFHTLIG